MKEFSVYTCYDLDIARDIVSYIEDFYGIKLTIKRLGGFPPNYELVINSSIWGAWKAKRNAAKAQSHIEFFMYGYEVAQSEY